MYTDIWDTHIAVKKIHVLGVWIVQEEWRDPKNWKSKIFQSHQ